jgi:hypothetical protein
MRIVPHPRVSRFLGGLALLLLLGCGRDSVTAPHPGLTGAVVLVGYYTDSAGLPAGTRVLAQADGVPVELVSDSVVVATTLTTSGRYTFTDVPRGAYKVRTRVTYDFVVETHPLTITDMLAVVGDTLRLGSRGDLYPYPNPFNSTLHTTFQMPASVPATLRVLDRTGATVRTLLQGTFPQGLNAMAWDGTDARGAPVPAGFYWLTLDDGRATRDQLVFRQ